MWLKQLCASGGDVMECNVFKKLILFKGAHKIVTIVVFSFFILSGNVEQQSPQLFFHLIS